MARQFNAGEVERGDLPRIIPEFVLYDENDNARWREIPKARVMEMARSLLEFGQEQPCGAYSVGDKQVKLYAGATRHKAGLLINKLELTGKYRPTADEPFRLTYVVRDFKVEKGLSEEEKEKALRAQAFIHSIIENKDRNATNEIDDANNVVTMLTEFKYSEDYVCDLYKIKKDDRSKWLNTMRRLHALPAKRKAEIEAGIINAAIGLVLAEIPEEEHDAVLADAEEARKARKEEPGQVVDAEFEEVAEAPATEQPMGEEPGTPARVKKAAAKKKAKKKAAPAPKKVTARDVVQAAKKRGHLKEKKTSRTIAQLREYFKPYAEDRKGSKAGRLALAMLNLINGEDADECWKEFLAVLR